MKSIIIWGDLLLSDLICARQKDCLHCTKANMLFSDHSSNNYQRKSVSMTILPHGRHTLKIQALRDGSDKVLMNETITVSIELTMLKWKFTGNISNTSKNTNLFRRILR